MDEAERTKRRRNVRVVMILAPTVVNQDTASMVVDRQGGGDNEDSDSTNALRQFVNFALDQSGSSYYADDEDLETLLSAIPDTDDLVRFWDGLLRELVNLQLEKLRASYYAGNGLALIAAIRLCAAGKQRPCAFWEKRIRPDSVASGVDQNFPKGKRLAALRESNPKLARLIAEIHSWVREKRFMPDRVAIAFRRESHDWCSYKRQPPFPSLSIPTKKRLAALRRKHYKKLEVYRRVTELHEEGEGTPIDTDLFKKVGGQMKPKVGIGRCIEYYRAAKPMFDPPKALTTIRSKRSKPNR